VAGESNASFTNYVREAVFAPLKSLREVLLAGAQARPEDPVLSDCAATIEQVVSALELAPGVDERESAARPVPTVSQVVRKVAERFIPFADMKAIKLQVDAQDLDERMTDHEQLDEAVSILADNALHYVPPGGQVVIGVRWMEHKGKPLLLFFVIDNGPVVPESLRQVIFEPSFVWNPSAIERTGRSLFKCREFAVGHAGSVWVESKTGKACTFFLRVRPDSAR
jgi:signal transduction histidine kinase